jgi:uncharacterized repeat protein (TIGR01451 family)
MRVPRPLSLLCILTLAGLVVLANPAGAVVFSNPAAIIINDGAATPYPSDILVTGLGTSITDVNVTLSGLGHTFPTDINVLLLGPQGQNVVLMSDVPASTPGCSADVTGVVLTFDDAAAGGIPAAAALATGTYQPTDNDALISCFSDPDGVDTYPAPAPPPVGTALSAFNGTDPNGTWSLYVHDDFGGETGTISGGWSLDITTATVSGADLEAGVSDSADPVPAGTIVRYTARIRNLGPDAATNVTGTISLPEQGVYLSTVPGQGSCAAPVSGELACSFGTIPAGGTVDTIVRVRMTHAGTWAVGLLGLESDEEDPVSNNNSSKEQTTINANTSVVAGVSCTIVGTANPETLNGTTGNDRICLLGGADVSDGKGGNDRIIGGGGGDNLTGSGGADTLEGGDGADTLNVKDGVSGNDTVKGGAGTDSCTRDPGDTQTGCP